MRYHERTLGVRWKKGVKRADKSNAIDLLCGGLPKSGTLPESSYPIHRSRLNLESSLFDPMTHRMTWYWPLEGVLTLKSSSDIERQEYESRFEVVPSPFTQEERERWLSQMSEVAVSSDAFVSHDNDEPLRIY